MVDGNLNFLQLSRIRVVFFDRDFDFAVYEIDGKS